MKETVIRVKAVFNNVYKWGRGFRDNDAARSWHAYWNDLASRKIPIFWNYCPPTNSFSCGYLASTAGSFYVHPLDFDSVLRVRPSGLKGHLLELEELCMAAAEAAGGTCEIVVSEPVEVTFEKRFQLRQVYHD